MANHLSKESSPYLLQHAKNPVNWYAWNDETLSIAKKENKLILISIGYSACHWCHVMERESFENEQVASIMNKNFINIKVDREERPDIDMLYMGAVQLMTGQGGWPLNCFALPDGRPIYGGTYFPTKQWINVLNSLADLFAGNPNKAYEYAAHLTNGLEQLEIPNATNTFTFEIETLYKSINKWKPLFDTTNGGQNKAPKFPLPNNYLFLLQYAAFKDDVFVKKQVNLTLTKMAFGGIYDQLAGGFARYSTDITWKVPHFEKMLYDNAQLISLYTQAYKQNKNELYKKIVYETVDFILNELTTSDYSFYSALDADTEGEEGKFYVWKKQELQDILKDDFNVFAEYYNINKIGYWEKENYILIRNSNESIIAIKYNLTIDELLLKIINCKKTLLEIRNKRIKPSIDTKILASWNGLACKALSEAYLVFENEKFKTIALANANFLLTNYCKENGEIVRIKNNTTFIHGFLEDYAFIIDAFMHVYLITADDLWLEQAKKIADYSIQYFYDINQNTFFFTDASKEQLVVRKSEWSDNVIPSSSSQMAINLHQLSVYFNNPYYLEISNSLLKNVIHEIENYGSGYSNWAILLLKKIMPQIEVVIVGKDVDEKLKAIYNQSPPNVIFAVSNKKSNLELTKNRYIKDETFIYVCKNNSCLLPIKSVKEALEQIEENTKYFFKNL